MLKPDSYVPDKWIFERINIPTTYIKCPVCGFSLNLDYIQATPYFCGGCGKDMRSKKNETDN